MNVEPKPRQSKYGIREWDLSDARDNELIQLPRARYFATLDVPGESYIRIGSATSPKIDLRDIEDMRFDNSIGEAYLENPAGSGTLRLFFGVNAAVTPESTISEIESITGTVNVTPAESGPFSDIAYGETTVATAGTEVALNGGTTQNVPVGASLVVKANTGNAGSVYVGESGVSASDGFPLTQGESLEIEIDDVSRIFVDSDTNGDSVRWFTEV